MNIYVGNLSSNANEEELKNLFSEYGTIKSVKVIKDLFSGACKGFGFVEMHSDSEAQTAIKELNARELGGKKIVVNEARPKTGSRSSGGRFNNRRNW